MFVLKNILRKLIYYLKFDFSPIEKFNTGFNSEISSKSRFLGSYHILNVSIDDYTYIALNAYISYATIGKYCSIGPNFLCGWGIHPTNGISTSPMFYSTIKQNGCSVCEENKIIERKQISIGNDVFIGANVCILDGITVGDGAVLGAGTVVSKDVPPYAIVIGCPMQIIKYRFDQEIINKLLKIKWWNSELNHSLLEKYFFDIETFIKEVEICHH